MIVSSREPIQPVYNFQYSVMVRITEKCKTIFFFFYTATKSLYYIIILCICTRTSYTWCNIVTGAEKNNNYFYCYNVVSIMYIILRLVRRTRYTKRQRIRNWITPARSLLRPLSYATLRLSQWSLSLRRTRVSLAVPLSLSHTRLTEDSV